MTSATKNLIDDTAAAMAEHRWDAVLANIAPEVVAHVPGNEVIHGIDGLAAFLIETVDKTDGGEHFEVLDTLVGERHGAIYFRITAERVGREPLDNHTVHLARIDDGKIVEIFFHNFDSRAVIDFWA